MSGEFQDSIEESAKCFLGGEEAEEIRGDLVGIGGVYYRPIELVDLITNIGKYVPGILYRDFVKKTCGGEGVVACEADCLDHRPKSTGRLCFVHSRGDTCQKSSDDHWHPSSVGDLYSLLELILRGKIRCDYSKYDIYITKDTGARKNHKIGYLGWNIEDTLKLWSAAKSVKVLIVLSLWGDVGSWAQKIIHHYGIEDVYQTSVRKLETLIDLHSDRRVRPSRYSMVIAINLMTLLITLTQVEQDPVNPLGDGYRSTVQRKWGTWLGLMARRIYEDAPGVLEVEVDPSETATRDRWIATKLISLFLQAKRVSGDIVKGMKGGIYIYIIGEYMGRQGVAVEGLADSWSILREDINTTLGKAVVQNDLPSMATSYIFHSLYTHPQPGGQGSAKLSTSVGKLIS